MNPTLSRKLNKVIEIKTDNKEVLLALENLSEFYENNNIEARRSLRGQIEARGIEINHKFLEVLESVQEHLDQVQENVTQMRLCCNEMGDKLQATREISGKLIHQAEQLNGQRKQNEMQQEIASSFLARFQLTDEEMAALKSNDINPLFFKALHRVHQIHDDCKILLRTQHQRAGLDIMDAMTLQEEAAYRKLYRWVRNECRKFEESSLPELSTLLRESLSALKERPVLLGYCLDEVAASRSKIVAKSFITALTQGGPNGMPRAMEMLAHDPIRYVGDMLAWIHQTAASEAEFLSVMVEACTTNKEHHYTSTIEDSTGLDKKKVLNTALEELCRPFHVRFSQILASQPGIVLIYRLTSLLDFYIRTIAKLTGDKAKLSETLNLCKTEALKVFYDALKEHGDKLQRNPPNPPNNLVPPQQIYEAISRLNEIIQIFDSTLIPTEEREAEFRPVLTSIIDPLLQACAISATRLGLSDMAVFMVNCLSTLQNSISHFDFAIPRVEMLSAHIKAHMDTLVQEQASLILTNAGLAQKLALLQNQNEEPLSRTLFLDAKSISDTLRSFEAFLLDPKALLMPQCEKLLNSTLRTYARGSVVQLIYNSYLFLYNTVMDPKNQYENPNSLFLYSPDQIKAMLDAVV